MTAYIFYILGLELGLTLIDNLNLFVNKIYQQIQYISGTEKTPLF